MGAGRFQPVVEEELVAAGWYPGRAVARYVEDTDEKLRHLNGWEMFPNAKIALLEFGGLSFNQSGPGLSVAREPFRIEPSLAAYDRDKFRDYEELLNVRLYPMGESSGGFSFLTMAEDGSVYYLMDDLRKIADTFDEALNNLMVGIAPVLLYR